MSTQNHVVREGISAGLIGAMAIAAWFAILDAVSGHLLATPVMLGTSLGSLVLQGAAPSTAGAFLGYTIFHFGLFAIIGIAFSFVVNGAERVPSAFIGFAMLFVAFEVGWVGWTMVLAEGFGQLTWLQVFLANLIASVAMGFYMWRQHPTLPRRVTQELAGVSAE
jgi:hypothetical protein